MALSLSPPKSLQSPSNHSSQVSQSSPRCHAPRLTTMNGAVPNMAMQNLSTLTRNLRKKSKSTWSLRIKSPSAASSKSQTDTRRTWRRRRWVSCWVTSRLPLSGDGMDASLAQFGRVCWLMEQAYAIHCTSKCSVVIRYVVY